LSRCAIEFLASGDPNIDPEEGHPIALETILHESAKYKTPPLFVMENSAYVTEDPVLSASVPEWLAKSRQIATGGRRRVLENGRDVLNSSDEDDEKMVADEEQGMYAPGMDPEAGPIHLSTSQAATQRFFGKSMRLASEAQSESEDTSGLEGGFGKLVARLRDAISPSSSRTPTPVTSDNEDEEMSEDQKRLARFGKRKAAFTRLPADEPTKGQQVPNSPKEGSRAGGFRGVDGSGSIGAVRGSSSPARKPGS
jgi:hypothetical protein